MSFLFELEPQKEASADFVADVGRKLQKALLSRKKSSKLSQKEIADKLGIDRSRVNRCFSGYSNLTLASLAELMWALNGHAEINLVLDEEDSTANHFQGCFHLGDRITAADSAKIYDYTASVSLDRGHPFSSTTTAVKTLSINNVSQGSVKQK